MGAGDASLDDTLRLQAAMTDEIRQGGAYAETCSRLRTAEGRACSTIATESSTSPD
jgi:hypothetical protein